MCRNYLTSIASVTHSGSGMLRRSSRLTGNASICSHDGIMATESSVRDGSEVKRDDLL